jgi:Uma2 family endonuclease
MQTLMVDDSKVWTEADYMQLGEEVRYEIIEGELFISPAPETNHQRVSRELEFSMYVFLKANKSGEIYDAPFDVYLDKNNIVQPDLVVIGIEKANLIDRKGLIGAPDVVVEIISPSTKPNNHYTKKELYQKFGVPEYWIADPADKTVEVLVLSTEGKYELFDFAAENGTVSSHFLQGYVVDIAEIFNF